MTLAASPMLALLLLVLAGQARPDFSGEWTRVADRSDEFAETIVVTHTADVLTISDPKSGAIVRTLRLDGSENKIVHGKPPRGVVEVVRATWEGSSLVLKGSGSSPEAAYLLRGEYSLDGNRLIVQVTQTNPTTGALLREQKFVFSK